MVKIQLLRMEGVNYMWVEAASTTNLRKGHSENCKAKLFKPPYR